MEPVVILKTLAASDTSTKVFPFFSATNLAADFVGIQFSNLRVCHPTRTPGFCRITPRGNPLSHLSDGRSCAIRRGAPMAGHVTGCSESVYLGNAFVRAAGTDASSCILAVGLSVRLTCSVS